MQCIDLSLQRLPKCTPHPLLGDHDLDLILTLRLSTRSFLVSTRAERSARELAADLRLCTVSSALLSMLARLLELRFRAPLPLCPSCRSSSAASSSISSRWSSACDAMSGDDRHCLHKAKPQHGLHHVLRALRLIGQQCLCYVMLVHACTANMGK